MKYSILESNAAYDMIKEALNDMPFNQKTITMRKDSQFFSVNYQNGGYYLHDNLNKRGKSPILSKEELVEDLACDMHELYHNNYTLDINNKLYKLRHF